MDENQSNLSTLERIQRSDHDTLIRLETKVDNLITNVTKLSDGTAQNLLSQEKRIASLELWKHDFSTSYKVASAIFSAIGMAVGFIVSTFFKAF